MNAAARLAAFVVMLALVFASAWALGAAAGPFGDEPPPAPHQNHTR